MLRHAHPPVRARRPCGCRRHLVWCHRHRKAVLQGAVAARLRALFHEIGYAYDIPIEERDVAADHVRLVCAFPPHLSIG